MKFKFLFIALFICLASFSQNKGTVSGTITDKDLNNETLPFANVMIKGTTIGVSTDMDGKYSLNVAAGNHVLEISFVGYETIEVPFTVKANETTVVDRGIGSGSVNLEDVVITNTVNRQKEASLLLEQKNAVEIKQSIGAQELTRKGVSDVATAVTKTTGISKQEGSGNVYVRGLGDRYNATTLNGLPLPSNNPTKKNINLEIFSTDIVEFIGIDKTYNYKNFGDFAGANIDIVSKNYKGNGFLEIGIEVGANNNAIKQDKFNLQDGPSFTGFSNNKYPSNPFGGYNFDTSWNTQEKTPIDNSISIRGGKSFDVGEEGKLSFFATGSFENEFNFREGVARSSVDVQKIARKDLTFDSYNYQTNTTLMGNLNYKVNSNNNLKFNSMFINSTGQKHEEFSGVIDRFDIAPNGGGFVRRSTFDRTSLYVNQLLGDHELNERVDVNWGVSYNIVNNIIPDRMQNTFIPVNDNNTSVLQVAENNESENHRYYQELEDNELAANLATSYKFNKDADDQYKGKFTVGYSGRFKTIDFKATQFNFDINQGIDQPTINPLNIDAYFNQANFNAGLFRIKTFNGGLGDPGALDPQTFNGNQNIHAGFGAIEYKFSPKLTVIAGIRAEYIVQEIKWDTALQPNGGDSKFDKVEVLPTAAIKYELNEKNNLKFAASKTYTLPQFKERAPFQYEEVTQVTFGNPDLYSSTDYNVDLKWEFFPKTSELISVTAFGKYIQNPINEVTVASATNDISYVNTGDKAIAIGGELEIRKNIFDFESDLKNTLSAGFNASYMYTNQDFNSEKVIRETDGLNVFFTEEEGGLTGASDLLLNADVSYFREFSQKRNVMATFAYNYFSDRIFAIGSNGRGNLVDKAVGTLDLILRSDISERVNLSLSIKNILDPTVERVQDTQDVIVESYKKGVNFKLGMTYKF